LKSAIKVIKEFKLNLKAIGLAKRNEEIILENGKVLSLPIYSFSLRLLQHIRNEAHRFALSYQRKLREPKIKSSILDTIPGLSNKRKLELLRYFGSIERIRKASIDELKKVPGIGEKLARKIYLYLRS
ncbi:MAG: helix-hairpin-helix domain-containing protein, partial [Candidatus Hydrothermia bacterium]